MWKSILLTSAFLLSILFIDGCKTVPARTAGSTDVNHKIDSLLKLMTLSEKIGQMTLYTTDWGSTGPTIREGYQNVKSGAKEMYHDTKDTLREGYQDTKDAARRNL